MNNDTPELKHIRNVVLSTTGCKVTNQAIAVIVCQLEKLKRKKDE